MNTSLPVERQVGVPFPVAVPVPQPYPVPHPVPQPFIVREPVGVPYPVESRHRSSYREQEYYSAPSYHHVERIVEEPIIIRRHRRRCRRRSSPPPQPIVIPIPIQAPVQQQQLQQQSLQITEYVQDIYPPAQVITERVPIGYMANNTLVQQPGLVSLTPGSMNVQQFATTSMNCQPGTVMLGNQPQQQQLIQMMEPSASGQLILNQNPGARVISPSMSGVMGHPSMYGTQIIG
ncbi:unnamed protein product [Didymodactylos carnosus]|uniref:Uncharacterized protein n=1 Tax=Didymodactylos carnosus TaxID=1234261 RepID=A0A8S2GQ88_9BILA|nr:unnamed protein product [Didymodactylos carnosus]CAF3527525.1 unnamed protein product [Didymodactylos carnosus]